MDNVTQRREGTMDKRTKVAFTTDRRGNRIAYRVGYMLRNFRIGVDEAEVLLSTGQARVVAFRTARG